MIDNPDYEGPKGALLRQQAREFAEERSQLFDMATEMRQQGNHTSANELVKQAKTVGEKMKIANRDAARAILYYNNNEKGFGMEYLDLHGLREVEAMEYLHERVNLLEDSFPIDTLVNFTVIPGAGHHSGPEGQKLKGATESYFTSRGFSFKEVNAGQLLVQIPGKSTNVSSLITNGGAAAADDTTVSAPAHSATGEAAPKIAADSTSTKKVSNSFCCVC